MQVSILTREEEVGVVFHTAISHDFSLFLMPLKYGWTQSLGAEELNLNPQLRGISIQVHSLQTLRV